VPVVVVSTLFASVALTVPPAVAAKALAAPVDSVIVPVKLIVAPVLLLRSTPAPPLLPIAPESVIVPLLIPEMSTAFWPAVFCVMVPA